MTTALDMQDAPTAEDDASFGVSTEPQARILNVTAAQYHADPCEVPSLSASCAKTIIAESPLHAMLAHPKLGGQRSKPTESMRRGTLYHRIILGKGADIVEIVADDYKTKAAQQMRDAAEARGDIPVLSRKLEEAQRSCAKIVEKLATRGVRFKGESEVAMTWNEEADDGTIVVCRAMMDHIIRADELVIDLKIVDKAHPRAVAKQATDLGYDIQHAAYLSAIRKLWPGSRPEMLFPFCEPDDPWCVTVRRGPDGQGREVGASKWRRAINAWARGLKTGHWPEYDETIQTWETPTWAVYQEMGIQ